MSVKISQLPAATALTGAEIIPLVQGGGTDRTTAQAVADFTLDDAVVALPAAGALTGTEVVSVVDAGVASQTTTQAIANLFAETQDLTQCIIIACSDELTPFASGAAVVTFRMPYAFTLTAVRASLTTAQASGNILTIGINEAGSTILSTDITITNTEKTSLTAVAQPVISDTALANDAEITIDIDQIGNSTATGLKVYLIGKKA